MSYPFRREAVLHKASQTRLAGKVIIDIPITWQLIGIFIFLSCVAIATFLSLARYPRVEIVQGVLAPDKGVVPIMPSRSGVIEALAVADDQLVPAGTALLAIRTEEDGAGDISPSGRAATAMHRQDEYLIDQIGIFSRASATQQGQFFRQKTELTSEITQLGLQLELQQTLVEVARKDYERVQEVGKRGFISARDIQSREENLLNRKQGVSQLLQSLASRKAALIEVDRNIKELATQANVQVANLQAQRAQLAQQAASAEGLRSYIMRAPVKGRVTALTARVGQSVTSQSPLMTIVPVDSTMRAELAVPSSAIGFVKVGQEVRLAIDAYPYQKFGILKGKVITVARSTVSATSSDGKVINYYPVSISLSKMTIRAYGKDEQLVPGMTLSARIVTENQSLLRWVFDPIYATGSR